MKYKKIFWLPVIGMVLFFSFYNKKNKNPKPKFHDKLSNNTDNTEPKFPQNVAACECEFNL